nr:N [Orthotospovirus citrullomaculosi] [Orthotospovirus citrullomaculosi]WOE53350.1 nucleocapsid protein [Orthotospovirus citrullomaculosi]WOE53351.1 nucleocapsid protein [Orthotospovirus citrullomaculosi]
MSNVKQLTEKKIKELLAGGTADVEIETEDSTPGFSFKAFFESNKNIEITFTNCLNILKCRKQIFAACKNGKYNFCGKNIVATSADVGPEDWTFKRTEAFIRTKIVSMVEKVKNEAARQEMYGKIMELPLVAAYGLNVPASYDSCALRMMLCIGGPLPLLSSIRGLAPIIFPLAYYQNIKKEKLGIKNFSTYEQVCKVAKVLSASQVEFKDDLDVMFKQAVKILSESNPGTASSISLKKYEDQVKYMDRVFSANLSVDDYGDHSKKSSKPSTSLEV